MKKIRDSILSFAHIGVFTLFVLVPCFLSAKEVTLTQEVNGKAISLAIGDFLYINLVGNMTTGFSWTVASQEGTSLKYVEHGYSPFPSILPMHVGSPGLFSFKFLAVSPGPSVLKLVYARSWEKGVPPVHVFKVFVDVGNKNR